MIGRLVGRAATLAYAVAETTWGHRRFEIGPPAGGFTSTLFGGTAVHRGQAGVNLTWRGDDGGLMAKLSCGPLELWAHLAGFDATALDPELGLHRAWDIRSQDGSTRTVHVYGLANNIGALTEWGAFLRLSLGPVGIVVEPGLPEPDGRTVEDLNARAEARRRAADAS